MSSLDNKFCLYLHIIIMFTYVWRSLTQHFVGQNVTYILTLVLLIVFCGRIICKKEKILIINKYLFIYIVVGVCMLFLSMISNGIVLSIMGFASLFLNLLTWKYSILINDRNREEYIKKYLKWFLFAMFVNALVCIYQYFVDASVLGLVSGLYGNELMLSNDNVTRRAVGFMGSPQTFSAVCGVALFVTVIIDKRILKITVTVLLIFAGFLSGSRAFGIFLILFAFYVTAKINKKKRIFIMLLLILVMLFWEPELMSEILKSGTLSRTLDFSRWAAFEVFFNSFDDFNWYNYLFGKGFGLNGWSSELSKISFDYSATESFLISVAYQLGIPVAILFVAAYFHVIMSGRRCLWSKCILAGIFVNLCVTPAFAGFAFSYVAWPIILIVNNYATIEKQSNDLDRWVVMNI